MEQADFRKYIKSTNARRLMVPVIFLLFIIAVFHFFSIKNWLLPWKLDDASMADEAYENGKIYVTCTVERMMYTGIDHVNDGYTDGYYYYSLEDGDCRYYLVQAQNDTASPVLENYTFHARTLKEDEIAEDLDKLMAQMLDWTEDGVDGVASDYILSEIDYDGKGVWLITAMMLLSSAAAVFHITTLLCNILNPYGALSFRYFGKGAERKQVVLKANDEYNRKVVFMSQGMYVTENYFIYHDTDDFEIIPLDDIVWAYKHSSLKWKIGTSHFITYNIRIVTIYKKTYAFSDKTKESCDALLDIIAEMRPEIMIGYTQENKVRMSG